MRVPAPNQWQVGTGPVMRALAGSGDQYSVIGDQYSVGRVSAAPMPAPQPVKPTPAPIPQPPAPKLEPAPEPVKVVKTEDQRLKIEETAVSQPPAPAPQPPPTPAGDPVADRIVSLVAEQTGYPEDMLDLDLDLEADLGIDTVKQAETFAAIRDEFDIPARDDLNLRSYNTMEKVIGFVKEMRPDLAKTEDQGLKIEETAVPQCFNHQSSSS